MNSRQQRPPGRTVNWVIKLSKLCNLRCGYCYEWNDLGDPRRMSAALIERVVQAAEDLHRARLETTPGVKTNLIMHGGEPLVLPLDYLRAFLDVARAHFGGLNHKIALQSNLFKISAQQIDLLKEYNVGLGMSYDVVPGVRLTVDGRESERRVEENIRVVREAGISLAAIVVLGKHTAPKLRRVYDHFAERGMAIRVLPLADGPSERPVDGFSLSYEETLASMCDLFDYWFESGLRVRVDPFRTYMQDAIRFMLGFTTPKYDRGDSGDYAFFANVDGRLYAERDAYDVPLALGDLNTQRMADVLSSEAYRSSLSREVELIAGRCPSCPINASCSGLPIVSTKSRGQFDDPCAIAPVVIMHIAKRLGEWGFHRAELARMFAEGAEQAQHVGA